LLASVAVAIAYLLLGDGLGALGSGHGHRGLEQGSLEEDVVVVKGLVDGRKDLFLHGGGLINVVVAVHEDFGLDDGDEAALLASASITGKAPGVLLDGEGGGASVGRDLEHSSPLAEACALGVVSGGALLQAVKARAPRLDLVSSGKGLEASVHLDTGVHASLLERLDEWNASLGALEERLLVKDGTRDVLSNARGREEKATVRLTCFFSVLHSNALEALANRLGRLIHGKNALSCTFFYWCGVVWCGTVDVSIWQC